MPTQPPTQDLRSLLATWTGYDHDRDGTAEINSVAPAAFEPNPTLVPGTTTQLVLVLVEPRLLETVPGAWSAADLTARLTDYHRHLLRDGLRPYFVVADVYRGSRHQDGLTLLAMRHLLREVRNVAPAMQGAVLIGSFPEAMLVRRWVWRHEGVDDTVSIGGITYNTAASPQPWLGIKPEIIAERSDIVLADLDGSWDSIYRRGPFTAEGFVGIPDSGTPTNWPQAGLFINCSRFAVSQHQYQDCFYIDDANFQISDRTTRLRLAATLIARRPEVGGMETLAINPIARPDILVSRINPRHVGVAWHANYLDSRGLPTTAPMLANPTANAAFARDAAMERRLLIEYLDRNLAHRVGARKANGMRTARLSTDLVTFPEGIETLTPACAAPAEFANATTLAMARFLKTPAVLKAISAHSSRNSSSMLPGYSMTDLATETGGAYWYWTTAGALAVPNYETSATRDRLGVTLLRTLWANGKLRDAGPTFYVHTGCQVNSVANASLAAYSSSQYGGHDQLAESLLFFGNGLAILSRAKVFNDRPLGFAEALRPAGGRFGHTLREYARIDSTDVFLTSQYTRHNRTYFWSILGDWTLRLDHTVPTTEAVATLWRDANMTGQAIRLPVGRYDVSLFDHSIGNDMLSSVSVAPGFRVRLFRHQRFQDEGMSLIGPASSLGTMNDQTSSVIIEPADYGGVRLFQHANFQGPAVSLDVDNYDVATLINTIGNDQLSSLTVQPGYEVRLFPHAGFGGTPLVLRESFGGLGTWNDLVSSLQIIRTP